MGVSENVVYPIVPNGFADHYPVFKWLFHWEYTLCSDKPKFICIDGKLSIATIDCRKGKHVASKRWNWTRMIIKKQRSSPWAHHIVGGYN